MARRSLAREVQRLRDETAEREADAPRSSGCVPGGLPVLTAEEVAEADEVPRIDRLVTEDGEPLPEEERPNVPGARVHVVREWVYPEDDYDEASKDGTDQEDEDYEPAESYQQYVPAWVVIDLDARSSRHQCLKITPFVWWSRSVCHATAMSALNTRCAGASWRTTQRNTSSSSPAERREPWCGPTNELAVARTGRRP